jgi:hypothetical protein
MVSLTLTDGLIILVKGDIKDEWHTAYDWQSREFIKAMEFGTMKSMCFPNPRTETKPFTHRGIQYKFIIINDWGPCYIKNMQSGREREVKYFELGNIYTNRETNNVKKTQIKEG